MLTSLDTLSGGRSFNPKLKTPIYIHDNTSQTMFDFLCKDLMGGGQPGNALTGQFNVINQDPALKGETRTNVLSWGFATTNSWYLPSLP